MTDYAYDLTVPDNDVLIGDLPGTIRTTKDQFATRLNKEHTVIVTGTGDSDTGLEHKAGSAKAYIQAAAPVYRPDRGSANGEGTGVALDTDDAGRFWLDTDDTSLYVYNGSDWTQVTLTGGIDGTAVALLAGRVAGQTLSGGTVTTTGLTLQANAAADASGTILFEGDNTAAIDFDSIPLSNAVLGANLVANSKKITGLADAASDGDALAKAAAVIGATELLITGTIAQCAYGNGTGSAANQTANVGFAPDLVVAWNDTNENSTQMWLRTGGTAFNKNLADGTTYTGEDMRVTVTSTTITFVSAAGDTYPNETGTSAYHYFALKFNAAAINPA